MVTGIVLGIAIAASTVAPPRPPAAQASEPRVVFRYDLSNVNSPLHDAHPVRWTAPARTSTPKPHSKMDRIIAVAAGTSLGFVLGGTIGGHLTENRDNPDDDTSPLRGIMIGAPIGAVLGGLTGYLLTK